MENPTGAGKKPALRVAFDSRLKLEFHGSKVTSDAGLLAYRELDAALGLTDLGENLLNDWRTGKNTQHSMVALMRQSIFSRLEGYEDTNDAEWLAVDLSMRHVVGGRATEHTAASTNQVRLQLFVLAYNLGNFLRQAVLPQAVRHWTLTTLREKLIKIGAKVVRHSRKMVFQMAEVAVPRELFRAILERIGRLRLATALSG